MSCFPCFESGEEEQLQIRKEQSPRKDTESTQNQQKQQHQQQQKKQPPVENHKKDSSTETTGSKDTDHGNITALSFTFRQLATATKNFRQECLVGEGGFGRVYKGRIEDNRLVAVKKLSRNGLQGNREFLVEVLMLSLLHHENLVNLIGYCADGDQRLLVYEYMSLGSLEDHLLDIRPEQKPLNWYTRMKIATGAAKGLEYLHIKANPPVIYRDLKSSNILLDEEFYPKLSDFGLAKLSPVGEDDLVSSRVMGTYGYCAPEYARMGHLTVKSDVFSFGVVLLELITGKRVIDCRRPAEKQNLVTWAQPIFKDPKRFLELADQHLKGDFPVRGLNQAIAVAAMCLQEEAMSRPMMSDVVSLLSFLSIAPPNPEQPSTPVSPPVIEKMTSEDDQNQQDKLSPEERRRAVAEAIEWCSNSRGNSIIPSISGIL